MLSSILGIITSIFLLIYIFESLKLKKENRELQAALDRQEQLIQDQADLLERIFEA